MKQLNNEKVNKLAVLTLFTCLFIYLLLRILYLDPLHDEVATYMFYFYQGDYIGESIHWDANNHLLNSFIGHKLYGIFGDNLPVLRSPNLLAFVFYFWGAACFPACAVCAQESSCGARQMLHAEAEAKGPVKLSATAGCRQEAEFQSSLQTASERNCPLRRKEIAL